MARTFIFRIFFRLVLLLALCYIALVALFITIPPYSEGTEGDYTDYHQRRLRAGQRLTSVYKNKYTLYYTDKNDRYAERSFFGIDWLLTSDVESNSINLHIGETIRLNLTDLARQKPPYLNFSDDGVFDISGRPGETDGVMMPWFNQADACMLNWEVDHETKIIEARAVVPKAGVVQIWPASKHWYADPLELPDTLYEYKDLEPFITIFNIPTITEKSSIEYIRFRDKIGRPPSRTFTVRRFIFLLLKPTTLSAVYLMDNYVQPTWEIFLILLNLSFMLALVCAGISVGSWWSAGRPPFDPWARTFILTKWLYRPLSERVIWGPGGFVMKIEDEEEGRIDEHSTTVRRLHTPIDFFRTQSPLDDLLNTFESTRWMTQPLYNQRNRNAGRFGSNGRRWSRAGDESMKSKV